MDELFLAYGVRLCAYARRWTETREVAEEVVQDVFLNLWANREQWTVPGTIASYLFRAVRNRALNHVRHERITRRSLRTPDVIGHETHGRYGSVSGEEHLIQGELHNAVDEAIRALPERSREIFLLNREYGLTYMQIAETLDISVKTVEYHMGRAFTVLRCQLADWAVL